MTTFRDLWDNWIREAALENNVPDLPGLVIDMIETEIGPLVAGMTPQGLALLTFTAEPEVLFLRLRRLRRLPHVPNAFDQARRELEEYFEGTRTAFDLALDLRGLTPFTVRVLDELARVPYGTTVTYGELAARAGNPNASRAVGSVMNRNRIPIVLPCHRVVGSSGALTGYAGGLDLKRRLLQLEGVLLS